MPQVDNKNYQFEPKVNEFSALDKFKTGCSLIDELNLNRIKVKMSSKECHLSWTQKQIHQWGELYRVFLFLCKQYPDEHIVPPREVDEFWHFHILDTRNYLIDCNKVFGEYLHHFPYAGLGEQPNEKDFEEKMKVDTMSLVRKHFPQLLGA